MSPAATASVGQTSAEIELPAGLSAVYINNDSEGIGDLPGTANVYVNVGAPAAISPQQIGIKLQPGQDFTFPLTDPATDAQQPIYAIADRPAAVIKMQLIFSETW